MKMYLCAQCHMAIKDNIKLILVKEAPKKKKVPNVPPSMLRRHVGNRQRRGRQE